MPRKHVKQRVLNRLTNRINVLLLYQEYIDTIIELRKELGININNIKEKASPEEIRRKRPGIKDHPFKEIFWYCSFDRVEAMASILLEKQLISEESASLLEITQYIPDEGLFWEVIYDIEIYWPNTEEVIIEDYFIIGGLCFDITEYIDKYQKPEFQRITKQLVTLTDGGRHVTESTFNSNNMYKLDEYLLFHKYIEQAMLYSRVFCFNPFYNSGENIEVLQERFLNGMSEVGTYLDITELSLDEIEYYWSRLHRIKEGYAFEPDVGRPLGIHARYEILRGMTWAELRQYIRENKGEVVKLEYEYLDKYENDNKLKLNIENPDGRTRSRWRSKAKQNFYKQIRKHKDTLDLKLWGRRKRRRPKM